jgi:hypothetical protein
MRQQPGIVTEETCREDSREVLVGVESNVNSGQHFVIAIRSIRALLNQKNEEWLREFYIDETSISKVICCNDEKTTR